LQIGVRKAYFDISILTLELLVKGHHFESIWYIPILFDRI